MIRVEIPATTANLGPGFDCLGLALDLWNTFELSLEGAPGTVAVETRGEGSEGLPRDGRNLVASTMVDETWPGMMPTDVGIRIRVTNRIPVASGLGSSSTAVLAGLVFASALSARALHPGDEAKVIREVQSPANLERVLRRAVKLEGHGDNVGPALLGGLVLVVNNDSPVVRQVPYAALKAVVCVPEFDFLTSEARAVLPGDYSRADTVHNIGHALLVMEALRAGEWGLLARGVADRVHEPYRLPLIPGAVEAKKAAVGAGAQAVCLSGAGPGLIAFAESGHEEIGRAMVWAFSNMGLSARFWALDATLAGARVTGSA